MNKAKKIVLGILLIAFVYLGFRLYSILSEPEAEQKEWTSIQEEVIVEQNNELTIDWTSLLSSNKDVVGWIYMPGTSINYPILQDTTNTYYINHTLNKAYADTGSIFLNAENNSSFQDDNSIIYGHSVQYTGGMFTELSNFQSREFYDSHKVFYILTPTETYRCNILGFASTTEGTEFYETSIPEENKDSYIESINRNLMNGKITSNIDLNWITLSTCNLRYGLHSNQRFVLISSKEKYDKPIILNQNLKNINITFF